MTDWTYVGSDFSCDLALPTKADEPDVRALLAAVQQVAREVEAAEGSAAVLTNLGGYQDSKHLHVHVYAT